MLYLFATLLSVELSGFEIITMKRLFIFFCVAALFLIATSCNKSHDHIVPDNSIKGSWGLVKISGNFTINFNSGDSVLKFTETDYEISKNGVVSKTGKYQLVNDSTVNAETGLAMQPGTYTQRIIFDNKVNDPKIFIEIADNKLTLVTGYFPTDGGVSSEYGRISGL
ncbi:MAG: hypothetical protein ABUT20_00085 [Bacteroidota bacterium]